MNEGLFITIEGGEYQVVKITEYNYLPMVELEDSTQWYIAADSEEAGKATRRYWEDLAQNDPEEFVAIVGTKTLMAWALGQYAGPGLEQTDSLEAWLDLTAEYPEEQWAGYDGIECKCQFTDEDGKEYTVCYRWN